MSESRRQFPDVPQLDILRIPALWFHGNGLSHDLCCMCLCTGSEALFMTACKWTSVFIGWVSSSPGRRPPSWLFSDGLAVELVATQYHGTHLYPIYVLWQPNSKTWVISCFSYWLLWTLPLTISEAKATSEGQSKKKKKKSSLSVNYGSQYFLWMVWLEPPQGLLPPTC